MKRTCRLLLTAGLVLPVVLYFLMAKQLSHRRAQDRALTGVNIRTSANTIVDTPGTGQHLDKDREEQINNLLPTVKVQRVLPPQRGADVQDSENATVLREQASLIGRQRNTSDQSETSLPPETRSDNMTKGLYTFPPQLGQLRKRVLQYFNPDKDFTVLKSQVKVGQLIRYEFTDEHFFNITEDFYRLIPETSPLLGKHFRSCAVVGNSGILSGSKCGKRIDSADFVIRCNLARLQGFQKDVGLKSNLTSMNPSVILFNYKGWDKKHTRKVVEDKFVRRPRLLEDQILYIPAFVTKNGREHVEYTSRVILEHKLPIKLAFFPRETNRKMKAIWSDSEFRLKRPSTGAYMFALAVPLCDVIHMYGFYPFKTDARGRNVRYHYYDFTTHDSLHNMTEEFRAFQKLHRQKLLTLHTGPCSDK